MDGKINTSEIIKQIILEATKSGKEITEAELMEKLDAVEGFWEQAHIEQLGEPRDKTGNDKFVN